PLRRPVQESRPDAALLRRFGRPRFGCLLSLRHIRRVSQFVRIELQRLKSGPSTGAGALIPGKDGCSSIEIDEGTLGRAETKILDYRHGPFAHLLGEAHYQVIDVIFRSLEDLLPRLLVSALLFFTGRRQRLLRGLVSFQLAGE